MPKKKTVGGGETFMKKNNLYIGTAVLLVVLVIGMIALIRGAVARRASGGMRKPNESVQVLQPTAAETKVARLRGEFDIQNAFTHVAETAGRAVVTISTERTQKVGFPGQGFRFKQFRFGQPFGERDPFERFFEDFFGQMPEREFKQRGLGSGFIIDEDGHIITNHHVIEGADRINVTLPDGRTFIAEVKGVDPRSDLAVIKIEDSKLPVAELGNSDLIQTGEWVVALGNPFGHVLRSPEPTVTVGVVSALHRQIPAPGGERGYLDMIQTDAAINPGNSGGPLCELNGKVIGINVMIFSTSGGYQGVGFAIPVNIAKDILGDLIKGKEIAYGWLGVAVQEITPEIAEYLNLADQKGALISQIIKGSPAEQSGLQTGDVVKTFDGKKIGTVNDLLREVSRKKVGDTVRVDLIRDRIKEAVSVTIGKRPSRAELVSAEGTIVPKEAMKWRGIRVSVITEEIARELGLADTEGVVIIEMDPSGPGYQSGLKAGDVIREINRTRIRTVPDFVKITGEASGMALLRTDSGYYTVKEE